MRYGIFDDIGNYCGHASDNYEDVCEKATELNLGYPRGLEDVFYHVENINEDELEDLDNLRDIDGDADIPF